MERIEGQVSDQEELAKQVLSWITCAKRPLTTSELQHALAVEVDASELDEDNLSQIEDMVSVCAGLVTVDEESGIIRLVHYTTQEYFERMQYRWFPNSESDIATTCVTYLSFSVFECGFCQTDAEFEERLRLNRLYDYAAKNWGHHAREASTLCRGVMQFLTGKGQIDASNQVLTVSERHIWYPGYSQAFPKQMSGLHLAAYFGVEDAVRDLLNSMDQNLEDNYGGTLLLIAAMNGHEGTVRLLLEKGADVDARDHDDYTALLLTVESRRADIVKLLLEKGANVNAMDTQWRQTSQSRAAANGHEDIIKLLLEKGANVNAIDSLWRQTPLSRAAANGHEDIVKLLLEKGADVDARGYNSQTPLWLAAESGRADIVRLLLEKGADANAKNYDGQIPLWIAAKNGHEAVVKLLRSRT
jgi:hypothetical protein